MGRELREQGRYAGEARLKLRWADFTTHTRQQPLASPRCDTMALRDAARTLFGSFLPLRGPVRLIGFGVTRLTDQRDAQLELFADGPGARDKHERISRTVDAIRNRFGPGSIGSGLGRPDGAGRA